MSLSVVYRPPGGQTALLEADARFTRLLEARFGARFLAYRRSWAQADQRLDPGPFPLSLDLALNSGCQLACPACPLPTRPEARRPPRLMPEKLYVELMAQARDHSLPALTLGLASEPLLNPHVPRWIALAERAGVMDVRLGTNGQALDEAWTEALLDSGLTRLEISIDAADAAVYAQVRPRGDYDRLRRHVELFLTKRTQRRQSFPLLRLSFLRQPANEGQLDDFLRLWGPLADLISIQKLIWFPGSRLPRPTGGKGPPADEADGASGLNSDLDSNDGAEPCAALDAACGAEPANQTTRTTAAFCVQPWQRLGLDVDGRPWPCCSWRGEGLLAGLSAQDRPVAELWRSPTLEALRTAHLAQKPPSACRLCARDGAF
ncbi:MAG: radical SAM protein [Deltaproteobacteria bacterium]|jgi:hypothetical protein|nr:radical SAM protein [Deltaproteobacteria bacterium]